jgi:hypothetical protein
MTGMLSPHVTECVQEVFKQASIVLLPVGYHRDALNDWID